MRGIVKIPSYKVRIFYTVETMLELAHHFLSTLKNVVNVEISGAEFSTFNPFVASSSLARPTKKHNEIKDLEKSKSFFFLPESIKVHGFILCRRALRLFKVAFLSSPDTFLLGKTK